MLKEQWDKNGIPDGKEKPAMSEQESSQTGDVVDDNELQEEEEPIIHEEPTDNSQEEGNIS